MRLEILYAEDGIGQNFWPFQCELKIYCTSFRWLFKLKSRALRYLDNESVILLDYFVLQI
jgi:hypothetical protein